MTHRQRCDALKRFHQAVCFKLRAMLGEAYHDIQFCTFIRDGQYGVCLHSYEAEPRFVMSNHSQDRVLEFLDLSVGQICRELGVPNGH